MFAPMVALFAQSFSVAISGALMPGPLLTVTISEATKKGTRVGPLMVLGHGISELAIISIAVAGLGVFLQRDTVSGGIGIIGGAVLLWMGIMMLRGSKQAAQQAIDSLDQKTSQEEAALPQSGSLRCVVLGFLVSVSSPYWVLWWLAPGLTLLNKGLPYGAAGVTSFYVGHILADLIWYWFVAFAIARGTHWLNVKGYRSILIFCGIILVGLGLFFGYDGATKIWDLPEIKLRLING